MTSNIRYTHVSYDCSPTKRRSHLPRGVYMHHLLASQAPGDLSGPDAADEAPTAHESSSTCWLISQAMIT